MHKTSCVLLASLVSISIFLVIVHREIKAGAIPLYAAYILHVELGVFFQVKVGAHRGFMEGTIEYGHCKSRHKQVGSRGL